MIDSKHFLAMTLCPLALASNAWGSDLSYTFMDFQITQKQTEWAGSQTPVPDQSVDIVTDDGQGISVAGSLAIGQRFYLAGIFQSAIMDASAVVTNPLGVTEAMDEFDLIQSRLAFGYLQEIGANFDLIFEVSYDSEEYDFGSFAGESFDMLDSGSGARLGFRWNPTPRFELFASGRYSSVATPNLDLLEFETGSSASVGMRWYYFEDLALGIDYETGDADTLTVSMRFSFGNLPW